MPSSTVLKLCPQACPQDGECRVLTKTIKKPQRFSFHDIPNEIHQTKWARGGRARGTPPPPPPPCTPHCNLHHFPSSLTAACTISPHRSAPFPLTTHCQGCWGRGQRAIVGQGCWGRGQRAIVGQGCWGRVRTAGVEARYVQRATVGHGC